MALAATPLLPLLPRGQGLGRRCAAENRFRAQCPIEGSDQVQLLEVLCLRRRAVQLLRRRLTHLSAGRGAVSGLLDRYLSQSRR